MKNEYVICGDVTAIKINTHRVPDGYVETLVDTNQLERLLEIDNTWSLIVAKHGPWYARCQIAKRHVTMHRLLTDAEPHLEVHHLNDNSLDNRIENLAVISSRAHRFLHQRDDSGLYFIKRENRYRPWISVEGKAVDLGKFDTRSEAVAARLGAVRTKAAYNKLLGLDV